MFSFSKIGIVGKIMSGYLLILAVSVIVITVSLLSLFSNKSTDDEVTHVYSPTLFLLKDLNGLVKESYNLSNGWVYQPNQKDKNRLNTIISDNGPTLTNSIDQIYKISTIESDRNELLAIGNQWKSLLKIESDLTQKLKSDEDYGDDIKVDEAITVLDKSIKPSFDTLSKNIDKAIISQNLRLETALHKKSDTYNFIQLSLIFAIISFFCITALASYYAIRTIQNPVKNLSSVIKVISSGKFIEIDKVNTKDEIGQMTEALQEMVAGLRIKAEFADKIGKGDYNSPFEMLSKEDTMGKALLSMRDNLKTASDEDKKRNWVSNGLAQFVDILRSSNNILTLGDQILSNLIRYLNANQGTLFVINNDDEKHIFLELLSCYAYDRKKYIEKKIEIGEGLVGQTYLEKETVYLTDVPKNYVHITSGLGQATPNSIIIVPLKVNEEVLGILEIASFDSFEKYQIDFIEKLGESIASALSSSRINEKTSKLLAQTTIQTEEMRSQEEEMRQNMEELSATQEELANQLLTNKRTTLELKTREEVIEKTIILSESDAKGTITFANKKLCEVSKYSESEMIGKGHNLFRHPDMPKELFKLLWETIKSGKTFVGVIKNKAKDNSHYWVNATIIPIFDEDGNFSKYISARYHITDDLTAETLYKLQMEKLKLPFLNA